MDDGRCQSTVETERSHRVALRHDHLTLVTLFRRDSEVATCCRRLASFPPMSLQVLHNIIQICGIPLQSTHLDAY